MFAIDYDNTYTAYPKVVEAIIKAAKEDGVPVMFVTSRHPGFNNVDLKDAAKRLGIEVVYCEGIQKLSVLKSKGYDTSNLVWVDDKPETIPETKQLDIMYTHSIMFPVPEYMRQGSYTMYLDDLRDPKGEFDYIVRSYDEAVELVESIGCPSFISFDHDLGEDGTGHDFAWYLVNKDLDNEGFIPKGFKFFVHSANPIGSRNITGLLGGYLSNGKTNS